MSEATYIKKLYLSNNSNAEGAEDLAGKVKYEELDTALQAMITDVKVKVSDGDQLEGKLSSKLTAGESIEFTILSPGGNESIEINSKCNVQVSEDDSVPAKLDSKLAAGDNIEFTVLNPETNESLEIKGQGKCKVSGTDSASAYLDDKIAVGYNMKKSISGTGNDEQLNIEVSWSSVIYQGLGWSHEIKGNAVLRLDEEIFNAESIRLKPVSTVLTNILYRENVSSEGPLGTLAAVGSAASMSAGDWEAIHGLYFLYFCNQSCWVNIHDNASITDENFKPILTGIGQDINFVKRALFSYNKHEGKWLLISYSKQTWFKKYYFGTLPANVSSIIVARLPKSGYYHFDVFCTVEELDAGGTPVNLDSSQILVISCATDSVQVDSSVLHAPPPASQSKVINTSLQGSGIINASYQDISQRWIKITAILPNGVTRQITGGYIDLMYCGEPINN